MHLDSFYDRTKNLKTIHYSSVRHTQVLFRYDYMFQSKKTFIRPTLHKLLKCVFYMGSHMTYTLVVTMQYLLL